MCNELEANPFVAERWSLNLMRELKLMPLSTPDPPHTLMLILTFTSILISTLTFLIVYPDATRTFSLMRRITLS